MIHRHRSPFLAIALIAALPAGTAAAQSVPGFVVSTYAPDVPGPVHLAFAPDGTLYCGRDFSTTGSITPQRLTRIGPGGAPVEDYGIDPTPDPDPAVVDVLGLASGVPGSVLTGGVKVFPSVGSISAVRPDQSVVELWSSNEWPNPGEMKFDVDGRLVFVDLELRNVWQVIPGGAPTLLAGMPGNLQPSHLAIAPDGRLLVSTITGPVVELASDGTLLNAAYAAFPARVAIEFGPGGQWGTDLYALRLAAGTLHRVSPGGTITQVGSGFGGSPFDIAFGPDGRLHVSRITASDVLVIEPEACSCNPAKPEDLDCSGTVDGGDLGLLLGAWGSGECAADLDGSGVVDGADLGILLGAWGT
ncbi:MAG TPA: hypothetical protein PKC43_14060 [Phycisphaerales bacterium]|nr:hypothetical protein [Phycisphaerales bacterium]HMP38558.1 hypothetical protein [Phycisphaerales bacterium]